MSFGLCPRCARASLRLKVTTHPLRLPSYGIHTSSSLRNQQTVLPNQQQDPEDGREALAKVRARAWYLDPSDEASPSSSSNLPSRITDSLPSTPARQPQFTTFDPSRTTSTPSNQSILPLPSNAPDYLRPLHAFLTSDEAAEVLETSSVVFLHTPSAPMWSVGPGELIRGEGEVGARWEWVVVLQVKGTGKGVVGRAERAIRHWVGTVPSPHSRLKLIHTAT